MARRGNGWLQPVEQRAPVGELVGQAQRGEGGTGRRQGQEAQLRGGCGQSGQDERTKEMLCCAPVEGDRAQAGMCAKKGFEIVGSNAGAANGAIQAARTNPGVADIPKRNAVGTDLPSALRIRQMRVKAKQRTQDGPEAVLRQGVILLTSQRSRTWQAAEDEYTRIAAGDGRKSHRASEARYGWRRGGLVRWRITSPRRDRLF